MSQTEHNFHQRVSNAYQKGSKKISMSREQIINHAVAVRAMEFHASMAAQAITSRTESKKTRDIYEHYQKHYKVGNTTQFIGLVIIRGFQSLKKRAFFHVLTRFFSCDFPR